MKEYIAKEDFLNKIHGETGLNQYRITIEEFNKLPKVTRSDICQDFVARFIKQVKELNVEFEDNAIVMQIFKKILTEMENEKIYEVVGIKKDGAIKIYRNGTIKQIEENELLNQVEHKNINDILRDLDCFSDYKHYAKEVKK